MESKPVAKGQTSRADLLKEIEADIQRYWANNAVFEVNAAENSEDPKFYVTIPPVNIVYAPHIDVPIFRAEFSAGYQRLLGKKCVFALSFSDIGFRANFPAIKATLVEKSDDLEQNKKRSVRYSYWRTKLTALGLSEQHLLDLTVEQLEDVLVRKYKRSTLTNLFDLKQEIASLGLKIDLRRSFTTSKPLLHSFLKWQFQKLHHRIDFTPRIGRYWPSIRKFLTSDQDLAEGIGEVPLPLLVIKQLLLAPYPEVLSEYEAQRPIYLLTSSTIPTLAIYGQTNIWVFPNDDYGLFEFKNNFICICSHDTANNLAYQLLSDKFGEVNCLKSFSGKSLIGAKAQSLSIHEEVFIWPAIIKPNRMRTGLEISCPSISALDCQNWKYIRSSEKYKEVGLSDENVLPFNIIDLVTFSDGQFVRTRMEQPDYFKRYSIHDRDSQFRHEIESGQFVSTGHIPPSEFRSSAVLRYFATKKQELIAQGIGFEYYYTDVVTRSGEICVVAVKKSETMMYYKEDWIQKVRAYECHDELILLEKVWVISLIMLILNTLHLKDMEICSESRQIMDSALYMNNQLAWRFVQNINVQALADQFQCSDINYNSLPTLCSAFSSIYHILDGNNISPNDMTYDAYEYIFGKAEYSSSININKSILDEMKKEFEYLMPLDLEVFTSSQIRTTALFTIFDTIEILGAVYGPKSFEKAPGILRIDRRTTVEEITKKLPADAWRFVIAQFCDSKADTVYIEENYGDSAVLKLSREYEWIVKVCNSEEELSDALNTEDFAEKLFISQIDQAIINTKAEYDKSKFSGALKEGFHEMANIRDNYRSFCVANGVCMNRSLIYRYIRTFLIMISPICPHITEHLWLNILKEKQSIMKAQWPTADVPDQEILLMHEYLTDVISEAQSKKKTFVIAMFGKYADCNHVVDTAIIWISRDYTGYCLDALRAYHDYISEYPEEFPLSEKKISELMSRDPLVRPHKTKAILFMMNLRGAIDWYPGTAITIKHKYEFNERSVLELNKKYIASKLGVKEVVLLDYNQNDIQDGYAQPYSPLVSYYHETSKK